MKKTLIKHGNSLALVIDKPILEMLQITPDTQLEISTNGDQLLVTPYRTRNQQRKLDESLQKINSRFESDLKKLAE